MKGSQGRSACVPAHFPWEKGPLLTMPSCRGRETCIFMKSLCHTQSLHLPTFQWCPNTCFIIWMITVHCLWCPLFSITSHQLLSFVPLWLMCHFLLGVLFFAFVLRSIYWIPWVLNLRNLEICWSLFLSSFFSGLFFLLFLWDFSYVYIRTFDAVPYCHGDTVHFSIVSLA